MCLFRAVYTEWDNLHGHSNGSHQRQWKRFTRRNKRNSNEFWGAAVCHIFIFQHAKTARMMVMLCGLCLLCSWQWTGWEVCVLDLRWDLEGQGLPMMLFFANARTLLPLTNFTSKSKTMCVEQYKELNSLYLPLRGNSRCKHHNLSVK